MSEVIEEQSGAELDLTIAAARPPERDAEEAPKSRAAAPGQPQLIHGLNSVYSYGPIPGINSGQLAVAALLDFWNRDNLGCVRTQPGLQGDSWPHYEPVYAVRVADQVQTGGLFGAPIPNKENMAAAFERFGLRTVITWAPAFGNGGPEIGRMRDWVLRNRLPTVCLLDGAQLPGGGGLRWSIFCGWSDQHALLAENGQITAVPWAQFQMAWHCAGLPWPNNFTAVIPYIPA